MTDLHVYNREIRAGENNSLSVLTGLIPPGKLALDLGCGTGAVGRFLARRDGEQAGKIDGLTWNQDEADRAAPSYRRTVVADLDRQVLTELFEPGSYDYILCADVLEHTRHPERILSQCRQLLCTGGQLLISIPNAAYAGLLAELMCGEFRYRKEGLLDETHLRFFTRRSLLRMLGSERWVVEDLRTIQRALPESEFRVSFDALPPAVARHLLGLPDAGTYQFIVAARPATENEEISFSNPDAELPLQALFTSELYLGQSGSFSEDSKITATGVMGQQRQSLSFDLPPQAPDALKFDPADRPGFMYLHAFRLRDSNEQILWEWRADDLGWLLGCPRSDLEPQAGWWPESPLMLLIHGNDPWFQLSIPPQALSQAGGGCFEAEVGWPMSADYMALAGLAQQRIGAADNASKAAQAAAQAARKQWQAQTARLTEANETANRLLQQNHNLRERNRALLLRAQQLSAERDEARELIHDIKNSTVFRASRPIVHAKMRIDRLLGTGSARPEKTQSPRAHPVAPSPHPVDVIIPVYKGLQDTRRCVESVLAAANDSASRLIIINDASPEPEVTAWLRQRVAAEPRITLLENSENLGFVATVNRGMQESAHNDVVLLNSDTEVAGNWLDRLRRAAYCDQRVASVTPFSNNATICSYPRFCEDNALPPGWDTAALDALFAGSNAGQVVDVPSGVGFCMYIRREALQQVGLFDVANFGKGYGEENDFCIRAANAGWRNLHALDVFVRHYGGVSFGATKGPRERAAMETLRRLHPRYEGQVLRFIKHDPAGPARMAVDIARICADPGPMILAVLHNRGGGTLRHLRELAELLHGSARFLALEPRPGHRIRLCLPDVGESFALDFVLPADGDALLAVLRSFGVAHIHFHHLLGHGRFVYELPDRLGLSYDFTTHDYYTALGNISLTDRSGNYCADRSQDRPEDTPRPDGMSFPDWRQRSLELLNNARYVIAPSRDVLARLSKAIPSAPFRLIPHADIGNKESLPAPNPEPLRDRPLKVAVIGALSVIKGADTLEAVALAARKVDAPLEFHLLGYAYRQLKTQPHARLSVHGAYAEPDLPELLKWLQPDVVWFPARWPETYSYTLSACLQGGWPTVAPDLGAFPERLSGRAWSWICPWDHSAQQWLDFFQHIHSRHFATGKGPTPPPEPEVVRATDAYAAKPPQWYQQTYLDGLPTTGGGNPSAQALLSYLPRTESEADTRSRALDLLVWLRNRRLLAPVARAIPQRVQTRVKSWLQR